MKHELRYMGEKITENSLALASAVYEIRNGTEEDHIEKKLKSTQHVSYRAQVFEYFGEALYTEDQESIRRKVEEWSKAAGSISINSGLTLSEALRIVSSYRTVLWDLFTDELEKRQLAGITMLDVTKIIDPLIDRIGASLGHIYEEHTNRLMKIAYSALEELSVPVVPIAEKTAIIPLVGSVDTERAKMIMEIALTESSKLQLSYLILDVSGVPIIDTMVADQLFHIINALELTGVQTYLTGIRPEIAQTIVSLGLRFDRIQTRANMKQALSEIGFTLRS
ncbi:STAS domain-containing protein [Peribacillus sp. SCS-37]|uniref:STAS domain-containing protein n=1 Tax=Paraperibacillus esterisolvens TaxID=3115296 RepID=UPI003905AEC6